MKCRVIKQQQGRTDLKGWMGIMQNEKEEDRIESGNPDTMTATSCFPLRCVVFVVDFAVDDDD